MLDQSKQRRRRFAVNARTSVNEVTDDNVVHAKQRFPSRLTSASYEQYIDAVQDRAGHLHGKRRLYTNCRTITNCMYTSAAREYKLFLLECTIAR